MTRHPASLQHKPFLTPIWLTVLIAFLAFIFLACAVWLWGTADATVIVIVPPAQAQLDAGADPPLTPAGTAHAAFLTRMFGDAHDAGHIDAIYVSSTLRSRMTAAPLAARLGLSPIVAADADPRSFAKRALREHAGGRILIVGHAGTMNAMLEALDGGSHLSPPADPEDGTLYVVSVPRIGRANVLRVSY